MNALLAPTCEEPTVALEPAIMREMPCPFRLSCWIPELADTNPSSVSVPDCAEARSGSSRCAAAKTARQRILWGWVIETLLRLVDSVSIPRLLAAPQVQRLMCVTVRGAAEACNR